MNLKKLKKAANDLIKRTNHLAHKQQPCVEAELEPKNTLKVLKIMLDNYKGSAT